LAAFTLSRYVPLLDGDLGAPLCLTRDVGERGISRHRGERDEVVGVQAG